MFRISALSLSCNWLRLTALCIFIFSLSGCAAMKSIQESAEFFPSHHEKEIERNKFPVARGEDVIGRLAVIRLEKGDTLPDIARHFSLGINAISAANPGVDVWVPEARERIMLPLSFILPDHPKKGDNLPAEVPPGPENPLGEYALYLSKSGYLIHGTNKPASIGLTATNGCLRLYPENGKLLFDDTPVTTPVVIPNQPYLIGQRKGRLDV